jgi:hypothetical protein
MTSGACSHLPSVDRHFAGQLSPDEERVLRGHMPECAACTRRYERHLLVESVMPSMDAKDRLRRGIPFPSRQRARWLAPAAGVLALAACALIYVKSRPHEPEFQARGRDEAPMAGPRLAIYRLAPPAPPTPVVDSIARGDELAFAYANPPGETARKHLMVFAVDEQRRVYWYYPAWTRAEDDPVAVAIDVSGQLVELREGVVHPFDVGRIRLYAIFTDQAPTTREVEARVAVSPPLAPVLGLPSAVETSRILEVR